MADENHDSAEAALRAAERLSAQVYEGLRAGARVDTEAVELACLLLDRGHTSDAVRELVARHPSDIPPTQAARLAADMLRDTGYDPGFALVPERLPVLQEAARAVAADFADSGVTAGLHIVLSGDDTPRALLALGDGTLLSSGNGIAPTTGDDPVRATVEIATEAQAEVADRFHLVWPVCPAHRLGLRPAAAANTAQWLCTGGPDGHVVERVGGLGITAGSRSWGSSCRDSTLGFVPAIHDRQRHRPNCHAWTDR